MKANNSTVLLLTLLTVICFAFGSAGCAENGNGFDVSGQENKGKIDNDTISTVEDIKSLVTDDDKLVINYYDSYIWTVFFAEDGSIDHMLYIYEFETAEAAADMLDTRKAELEIYKSMTVTDAKCIDNYVVIELIDTSFEGVLRENLENNFQQFIVK